MGRSTKLDDLVEKRVLDALKAGHSYAAAARAGGIAENTLHEWVSRGRGTDPDRDDPDGRYAKFAKRVDAANHEAEDLVVGVLRSKVLCENDRVALDAAKFWLERRRAEDWGPKKGDEDAKLPSDEECLAIVRKVRESG
jgi:transposase-like protein